VDNALDQNARALREIVQLAAQRDRAVQIGKRRDLQSRSRKS
jgi:hypothetical protein